ncbi:MAG: hypothetical protein AAFQ94_16160 [Bacteroidota bacterium]
MKYIGLLLVGAMLLTSCFDDPGTDIILDESFVELDAARTVTQLLPFNYLRENDGVAKPSGFLVNRVSTNSSNAVNVTIAVDQASTAIEGLHYNLVSSTVTIPAGEFSAAVGIEILADNIEVGEELDIVLEIVSADLPINQTVSKATHRVSISCPITADYTGTYRLEVINNTAPFGGSYGDDGDIVEVRAGVGQFDRVFTNLLAGFAGFERDFEFSLICESIKVPFQDHGAGCGANPDTNLATGPPTTESTFDPTDDAVFIINLTDNASGDCDEAPVQASYRFVKQ